MRTFDDVGATAALLAMAGQLSWDDLPDAVRSALRRHFLDTCATIIAGMPGEVAGAAARVLAMTPGSIPVPASALSLGPDGFAMLCGTAAHGIELDDGHRGGSVHPGVAVVPALLALASVVPLTGRDMLLAQLVGYESITALAAATNPALRNHGFHPTSAAGPLGSALAVGRALRLNDKQMAGALGIAASSAGGLFAFLAGGGDVKRLHGGMAARAGLMAALFAREGVSAPADIIEAPSGWAQAFAGAKHVSLSLPPTTFNILDCYFKPYACCRHLQPAMEALIKLRDAHGLSDAAVHKIEVETYSIAAKHAATGWADMASAQLSFPYCLAVALQLGRADLVHFGTDTRSADWVGRIAARVEIRATPEMDALYPAQRPARVTVHTAAGPVSAYAPEARGCRDLPLSDTDLLDKARGLIAPVLGQDRAEVLIERLWTIELAPDASQLFEGMGT